jgi:choline dehydrogenase-like flavoprotein/predicted oxidoreductase
MEQISESSFDYVIVGAGTAGCALAAKILNQTQGTTVLLLERGGPNTDFIFGVSPQFLDVKDALMRRYMELNSLLFPTSSESSGRNITGMVGNGIGGSSAVNGSVFNLPSRPDINSWALYSGLSPEFFEQIIDELMGSLSPSTFFKPESWAKIIESFQGTSVKFVDNYNDWRKRDSCISWIQFLHDQISGRFSTSKMIEEFRENSRLKVVTNCTVETLVFTGKNATGLSCSINKVNTMFTCKKAVAITSGTFGTATILQKSGICMEGSQVNLPVGKNLRDHFVYSLRFQSNKFFFANSRLNNFFCCKSCSKYFFFSGMDNVELCDVCTNGSMTSSKLNLTEFVDAVNKVGNATLEDTPGRLLLYLKSFDFLEFPDTFVEMSIFPDNCLMMYPMILSPFSSGTVVNTKIQYNAFAHPFDTLRMRLIVRKIEKIMLEFDPDCRFDAEHSELDQKILKNFISWTHPVGTCSIGSVLNSNLQVHNTENLFVADCSAIPLGVHGGTFATALCIASYGAKCMLGQVSRALGPPTSLWQVAGSQKLSNRIALGFSHFVEANFPFLDEAVSDGFFTFHTANVYPGNRFLGMWLKQQSSSLKSRFFIVGTGCHPNEDGPRLTRACMMQDARNMLETLGVARLDCFMVHRDDPSQSVEDVVTWLNEVVHVGLASSYGVSNWTKERIHAAQAYALSLNMLPIGMVSNCCRKEPWEQPPWPGCVQMDYEETKFVADELKIPIMSWSFLSQAGSNVTQSMKDLYDLSPSVGIVVRTTTLQHLRELASVERVLRNDKVE